MANVITCIRIICSLALLFCLPFSALFYTLYIIAGVSDMIDGAIARRTGTVSELGSKLDTAADFILVAVCFIKLLPVLDIEAWVFIWVGIITLIKLTNIAFGIILHSEFIAAHSAMNKITGVLLFVLLLTAGIIDIRYSAGVVCIVATVAAVQEGYLIYRGD